MTMIRNARQTALLLASAALGSLGMGFSASAAAECSCMCIEGVSYDVCTGFVNTQTVTPACTESLQCPEDPSAGEAPDTGGTDTGSTDGGADDGAQQQDPNTAGMDCRMRNVYRPDKGRYEPHPVCLPARAAAVHEWAKANREEYLARLEARQEWFENHRDRDRRGRHADRDDDRKRQGRGRWDRHDDDDDRGRRGRGHWDDRDDDDRGRGRWGDRDDD